MTNVVPFPGKSFLATSASVVPVVTPEVRAYDFTSDELILLYRWYSAMRYAFPGLEGVMTVCHRTRVSAVGLYGAHGAAPSCLISKHESNGNTYLLWSTDRDPPRALRSISEIVERQILAIDPPGDEAVWLDAAGWMAMFSNRMVAATPVSAV
jgi:hypothetical protein